MMQPHMMLDEQSVVDTEHISKCHPTKMIPTILIMCAISAIPVFFGVAAGTYWAGMYTIPLMTNKQTSITTECHFNSSKSLIKVEQVCDGLMIQCTPCWRPYIFASYFNQTQSGYAFMMCHADASDAHAEVINYNGTSACYINQFRMISFTDLTDVDMLIHMILPSIGAFLLLMYIGLLLWLTIMVGWSKLSDCSSRRSTVSMSI